MLGILKDSLFVAVPSRMYENAPYTILEAMGFGKAVLTKDIGGAAELIQRSGAGVTFKNRDINDLAEKLKLMLSDKGRLVELGESGKKFIKKNYSDKIFYRELMKVYEQAKEISQKRSAGRVFKHQHKTT